MEIAGIDTFEKPFQQQMIFIETTLSTVKNFMQMRIICFYFKHVFLKCIKGYI